MRHLPQNLQPLPVLPPWGLFPPAASYGWRWGPTQLPHFSGTLLRKYLLTSSPCNSKHFQSGCLLEANTSRVSDTVPGLQEYEPFEGAQHLCGEQGCEGGQGKSVMVSSPGGGGGAGSMQRSPRRVLGWGMTMGSSRDRDSNLHTRNA